MVEVSTEGGNVRKQHSFRQPCSRARLAHERDRLTRTRQLACGKLLNQCGGPKLGCNELLSPILTIHRLSKCSTRCEVIAGRRASEFDIHSKIMWIHTYVKGHKASCVNLKANVVTLVGSLCLDHQMPSIGINIPHTYLSTPKCIMAFATKSRKNNQLKSKRQYYSSQSASSVWVQSHN